MRLVRSSLTGALGLALALAIGSGLTAVRPVALHAHGGDRSGESVLASGPVLLRYNDGLKVQIAQDVIYYLDYGGGRLVATVPSHRPTGGDPKYLGAFVERDLVADFKLNLDAGQKPHFLMTTASLGVYSDGGAPLFVFETTTKQVAVYRVQEQTVGTVSRPRFELVDLRAIDPRPVEFTAARPEVLHAHGGDRSGESSLTSGPVLLRYNDGLKVQIAQDAIYYLDYGDGAARLVATIPSYRPTIGAPKYVGAFAQRDLVADFKLDLDAGQRPHFMVTTGALGVYSDGGAPLFVFETTTKQVAVYRVQDQTVGTVSRPRLELVELRAIDSRPPTP